MKLDKYGQAVFEAGRKKAILTRLGSTKWVYALGYAGEVRMSYDKRTTSRRYHAMSHIHGWLSDQ